MGYEQAIPPIPDRAAQLAGIHKLQQSWLSQPYWKFYMNESLRQPKLAFTTLRKKIRRSFLLNLVMSTTLLFPLALLSRRWFISRGRIPITYKPDCFEKYRVDYQIREYNYTKWIMSFHIVSAFILAHYWTDREPINDINYEFIHKTRKMM